MSQQVVSVESLSQVTIDLLRDLFISCVDSLMYKETNLHVIESFETLQKHCRRRGMDPVQCCYDRAFMPRAIEETGIPGVTSSEGYVGRFVGKR